MRNPMTAIEFHIIRERLAEIALSERARDQALALAPTRSEAELRSRLRETTGAKIILEGLGSPPLSSMVEVVKALRLCEAGAMLAPEQLTEIAGFLNTCGRARNYLKRAELLEGEVSLYGANLEPLPELQAQIEECIQGETVSDHASPELKRLRRKMDALQESIRTKLEGMLRGKREWFSEGFVVQRNGRYALPVKKEWKGQVQGTVLDISGSGGTYFIEPTQARKLTDELAELGIAEDNEVRRVLYTLTAEVEAFRRELRQNVACMETLDFLFAKARLSSQMRAVEPEIALDRRIRIVEGRHPLLESTRCVPLNFELGGAVRGVVVTGPNTGGKTVALKTVGLLSIMAQAGLHVPTGPGSVFAMHANVLCDIGDGQSITENLSTFSSHMTNIIGILAEATHESLVLLDELGSGTDPAEGMGLAVAILEELRGRGCLFVTTSHYPELKDFAARTEALTNARMAFDRESLAPLYRLEMGEAGESCALYIAQRLGFPPHMLEKAWTAAYEGQLSPGPTASVSTEVCVNGAAGATGAAGTTGASGASDAQNALGSPNAPSALRPQTAKPAPRRCDAFQVGDSVRVYPQKDIGIVYRRADEKGNLGVQVKGSKLAVNHKRVKLLVAADALYPDDYDFSIVFDSVANRKARNQLDKGHRPEAIIRYESEAEKFDHP